MNEKEIIRKKFLEKRKLLNKIYIKKMSYKISLRMNRIIPYNKKHYNIFLPIKNNNEFNTFFIIDFLLKKKKCITVPYSNFRNFSIKNCIYNKKTILKKNPFGIMEPVYKKIIPNHLIEVIFIPLIIFDINGYRIGYGKGFYDRMIPLCKKNLLKIGMSFFHPIKSIGSIHKHDIYLDIGVTPDSIFFFKK
ncbi:5-formyltetrahydrofolate cyclo-ligase [Blattabacterium cuenoti]|uniref:5-formyltetrahydrofolate cyclo-ligase n=1 Tax=Blattabacterium cuenoti TaxID=1653831 RepID=UPI00163D0532|nr:5-formyltetrahydrofolate cyclo-ligase [Blattabacterium cuenoti]